MKFCTQCGTRTDDGDIFCGECGTELRKSTNETNNGTHNQQSTFENCQVVTQSFNASQNAIQQTSDRVVFGIMCILFNAIGIPCFMRGRVIFGILRIILMCATFGVFGIVNGINGIMWGIRILKMSEEEYQMKKNMFGRGIAGI